MVSRLDLIQGMMRCLAGLIALGALAGSAVAAQTPTPVAAPSMVTRPTPTPRDRLPGPTAVYNDPRLRIEVYARGGAPSSWIANYIEDFWPSVSLADAWIAEWGINDADWYKTNPSLLERQLCYSMQRIDAYATSGTAHVRVFIQELQPIYLDPADKPAEIALRQTAQELVAKVLLRETNRHAMGWIAVATQLQPGVHGGADAWVDNMANLKKPDGIHLRAKGIDIVARQYQAALRVPMQLALARGRQYRVCLFGDSILAGYRLPENERLGRRLFDLLLAEAPPAVASATPPTAH